MKFRWEAFIEPENKQTNKKHPQGNTQPSPQKRKQQQQTNNFLQGFHGFREATIGVKGAKCQ